MSLSPEQLAEIEQLREQRSSTLRAVSDGMEGHLYTAYPVLDHGFVRVIDYMGDDAAICQAARVSYGKGTKSVQNDEGLIRYLMRHWHSTPFEMCEIKLHVKLPVFVARQWIRHRTANVNEYSARYSILDREFYIPAPEHVAAQSVVNNQGRGDILTGEEAARVLEILKADSARAYDNYESMISQDGQQGLARELARMNLPANIYTHRCTCPVRNPYLCRRDVQNRGRLGALRLPRVRRLPHGRRHPVQRRVGLCPSYDQGRRGYTRKLWHVRRGMARIPNSFERLVGFNVDFLGQLTV